MITREEHDVKIRKKIIIWGKCMITPKITNLVPSHTIHKNWFKECHEPKCKSKATKLLEENMSKSQSFINSKSKRYKIENHG